VKVLRVLCWALLVTARAMAAALFFVFGACLVLLGVFGLCGAWAAWPFPLEWKAEPEGAGGVEGHAAPKGGESGTRKTLGYGFAREEPVGPPPAGIESGPAPSGPVVRNLETGRYLRGSGGWKN
jgi:hypothetical protein